MSLLYRFVSLPDRNHSHVFAFIVTKSVTRDLYRDVTSKEFVFGHHKWAITFSRTDKIMGVYLVWRSPSSGVKVFVDFSFTLLNREHFSANETFAGKNVKFTLESPAQGNRRYIAVQDLYTRNFADINGEFQLELQMSGIRTVFSAQLRPPPSLLPPHHPLPFHRGRGVIKSESGYFSFGGFDWNVALVFGEEKIQLFLQRINGFEHCCRIRYVATLGEETQQLNSGLLDDISDTTGKSYGWIPRSNLRLHDIINQGVIKLELEVLSANTISEICLLPSLPNVEEGELLVSMDSEVELLDKEKQRWALSADCLSSTLRLRIVYKDIGAIPRNHLRYVAWSCYLLRYNSKSGTLDPISCAHAPYSRYYGKEEGDEGIMMETDVNVKEIRDPTSFYLNEKQEIRVQIEWLSSVLLFQSTYHKYDDVARVHNHQMRKEITALQAENYSLERQLFSYQKSLAYAHSASPQRPASSQSKFPGNDFA